MTKTKAELVVQLNRYLLVEVDWERMSEEDLQKSYVAFEKLRVDIEEVFHLLDEVPTIIPDRGEWRRYTI